MVSPHSFQAMNETSDAKRYSITAGRVTEIRLPSTLAEASKESRLFSDGIRTWRPQRIHYGIHSRARAPHRGSCAGMESPGPRHCGRARRGVGVHQALRVSRCRSRPGSRSPMPRADCIGRFAACPRRSRIGTTIRSSCPRPRSPGSLLPGQLPLSFSTDREGNIARVAVPLEPLVKDIAFIRVAAGD